MKATLDSLRAGILCPDFIVRRFFPVSLLIALALFVVLTMAHRPSYTCICALALPFAALGATYMALDRHWLSLLVSVVLTIVVCVISIPAGLIVLCLSMGAEGLATVASAMQCMVFLKPVAFLSAPVSGRWRLHRIARSVFGIPEGIDTRDMESDHSIVRHSIPWKDMLGTAIIALPVSMLIWVVILISPHVGGSGIGHLSALISLMLYPVAVALVPAIYGSLNVRVGTRSGDMSLYQGLKETAVKFSVILALMFLVVLVFSDYGEGELLNIILCMAISALMTVIASLFYYIGHEPDVVAKVSEDWSSCRKVSLYCELDILSPPSLSDGVPGTPSRRDRE